MKKYAIILISFIIGLSSAVAGNVRATFAYGQTFPGIYTRLINPIDPSQCLTPTQDACYYVSPSDLGSVTSKSALVVAGAVPSIVNRVYAGQ